MNIYRIPHFTPSQVSTAWAQLTKRPQDVYVVSRGDKCAIRVGEYAGPGGLAGRFDMGIPLDDFADELEHAARDLD